MAGRILLNKAGKRNHGRKCDLRVAGIAPRQAVSLGLIAIHANEPLRATIGGRQHVRACRKLNRTAINAGPRIDTKLNVKWRTRAAEIAKSGQIQVEPGIRWKE